MTMQPNILLITTDQQRYDTICAGGYEFMKTPNLDRLVKQGCLYKNAYSPNPACIPARHNIITGLTSKSHGFDDNYFNNEKQLPYDVPTFPGLLQNAGYETIAIGKMHFSPARAHNGFGRMKLMEEIPKFRQDDDYAMYLKDQGLGQFQSIHGVRNYMYMMPQQSYIPTEHHGTTWVTDQTLKAIEENNGGRPFMIWSSYIQPHPPFDVPSEWANLYDDVDIPLGYDHKTPLSAIAEENKGIANYPNDKYFDRAKRLYLASISFVDYNIGMILDYLEETNQIDNTVIVFTSDHGEMMNDNQTYQKFLPYDSSSKVPFIVRYPEYLQAGSVVEEFVDLNDLLPTFLDVAGVTYPANHKLPGESLFSELKAKDRNYQFIEHNRGDKRWISIRTADYKLNYYYGGGLEELFDMKNDPLEQENLLHGKPYEFEDIRCMLMEKLVEYEKLWGLRGYVVNDKLIKMEQYKPHPSIESTVPLFIRNLSPEERETLLSFDDEIKMAIKDEPVTNIKDIV